MTQQMTFIGIVSGMQLMSVLVGDSSSMSRFLMTFMFGLGVALLGLATAWSIRDPRLGTVNDPKSSAVAEPRPA